MATPVSPKPEAASPQAGQTGPNPRPARPPRPNYRHIHRFPLPLNVHPVPPLIPHNPLSLISIALSYLTFLCSPPHQQVYTAYFDSATSSVHVTDEAAIKALWQMGFFGKGNLSRSEPSWLEREKKRRGLLGGPTSEEATRKRRTERRELKLERARMEKLAIQERLEAEAAAREADGAAANGTAAPSPSTKKFSLKNAKETKWLESQRAAQQNGDATVDPSRPTSNGKTVRFAPIVQEKQFASNSPTSLPLSESILDVDVNEAEEEEPVLENQEHLQLSNEETFFLVYGLGALRVLDDKHNAVIPTSSLFPLLCHHSYYPPRTPSSTLQPDDPFIVSYVVYHHFRSLGWVVRSGVKFGADYMLYNRGPVFSHAEFAVAIIPSYDHAYWSETEERREYVARKQARSWWWLHCVNRVQAQVFKSLVLCYVDVPPPSASPGSDIGATLSRYRVRDFSIKRWVPNRSRD